MQSGATVSLVFVSQLFHPLSERLIAPGLRLILAAGAVEIDDPTGTSFTEPKAFDCMHHGCSLRFGR